MSRTAERSAGRRRFLRNAATSLAVVGMGTYAAESAPRRLRRARAGNLTSLDPHRPVSSADMEIAADLFCGLTAVDATGQIVPGCASSWQISADGLRVTFVLRPGLRWSDGVAMTADDFVQSYRRLLDPATGALLGYRYAAIAGGDAILAGRAKPQQLGVRAADPRTVVFTLDRPEADLLKLAAVAYVVPTHAVARLGRDWAKPPQMVVNGAWQPVSWEQNGALRLQRNPQFFEAATVKLEQIEWLMGIDDATRLRLFRAGDLDIAQLAEGSQVSLARKEFGPQLHSQPAYAGGWVGLQTQRPSLRDARVRRALSLAVDRRVLVDKVRLLGERPSESLVPDAVADYPVHAQLESATWPPAQRLAAARELMAAAGYSSTKPLALTAIFSANPLTQRTFLALGAMWRPLGVVLDVRGLETRAYNLALRAGDYDLMDYQPFSAVQSATSFISRFHSRSFLNYSKFASPEVDALIDAAERQPTLERRAAQYRAVEQLLLRDTPVIPLYSAVTHTLVSPRVRGWARNASLSLPSRFLSV